MDIIFRNMISVFLGYQGKDFHPEGGWVLEKAFLGGSHSTSLRDFKKHLNSALGHMLLLMGLS